MEPLSDDIQRFLRYLSFKMDCLREQEIYPLTIDITKAQRHYDELDAIKSEKTIALAKAMPKVPVEKYVNKPKVMTKKDGSLSAYGEAWYKLLKEQFLPDTTEGTVTIIEGWEDGNPNSPSQVKEWLYSLGWKPCTYKFDRDKKTGDEKKIEQVRYSSASSPRKGELTDSVLKLKSKDPAIEVLEGLTVASHRMSIFKGFLTSADNNGKVVSSAGGFTNTMRLKHRAPIVNMPKVGTAWGEEIRACIVAPAGHVVCGSDVTSLEDMTKRHYMKPLDPDYVEAMDIEGFDPHMKLLVVAGKITDEDYDFFSGYSKDSPADDQRYKRLKAMRGPAKVTNYSSLYGVGKVKLAREAGMSVGEAGALIEAFWAMNWAIKKVAKDAYVKTLVDGSMWVKNPVSGFYYSLRNDRDVWSTLNQGTGVFIFDSWVLNMRNKGIVVNMQYHDEVLSYVKSGKEGEHKELIKAAMRQVNETLKLNVEITSDIQFGDNYAAVH
jgi:major membrane immunogen (membrane-anchored lipoprotein)